MNVTNTYSKNNFKNRKVIFVSMVYLLLTHPKININIKNYVDVQKQLEKERKANI